MQLNTGSDINVGKNGKISKQAGKPKWFRSNKIPYGVAIVYISYALLSTFFTNSPVKFHFTHKSPCLIAEFTNWCIVSLFILFYSLLFKSVISNDKIYSCFPSFKIINLIVIHASSYHFCFHKIQTYGVIWRKSYLIGE